MGKLEILIGTLSILMSQGMCLSIFLDRSKVSIKRIVKYVIYISTIITFLFMTHLDVKVAILLMGICFANFLFEGTFTQKIWVNLLGITVIYGIGNLDYMISETVVNGYGSKWFDTQIIADIRVALEICLLWLLAKQSSLIYKTQGQYKRITRRQAWMIIAVTITAMYILFICNAVYIGDFEIIKNISVSMYAFISIICITLLILGINEEMNKLYYKWTKECMSEQLEKQLKYYHKLEEINKETRAIKHDIRNHMIIIRSLAQKEQLGKLEEYVEKIENTVERLDHSVYTGNSIVDAILNEKLQIAKEKNIEVDFEVKLSNLLDLDDMDLCVIFANSLDNAIEACEMIENIDARKIQMKAICDRGYFFYNIKNTARGMVKIVNKEVPTNKKDSINHGFGLASIRNSVERNRGNLSIISIEEEFCLEIDIPISYVTTA